jgi:hypothetical protein
MSSFISEKSRLLNDLREGGAELVAALRAVPTLEFDQVRSPEGWLGRDFVAHIAATDLVVGPRLIQLAARELDSNVAELEAIPGFPNAWTERDTAARRTVAIGAVIDEVEHKRQRLIQLVEDAHEDRFEFWLPNRRDTAAGIIRMLSGQHVRQHAKQAIGERLPGGTM